ncbi:MAG: hypothetical protein IT375_24410 [Polyangiaceae bacterium]|nr:hypothetical protein [Polyangiaceae bacterium]
MTHRARPIGLAGALLLAGCAIEGGAPSGEPTGPTGPTTTDPGFPPIDGDDKYFKPGPPLATVDETELDKRFAYHQQVIDAHGYSYSIKKSEPTHLELPSLAGFVQPADVGKEKPKAPVAYDVTLPESWDWRKHGAGMPPIRQQGSCGSCWAFGTVGVVEAAVAVADKQLVDLSEQLVLDCSGKGTCGGGYWAYTIFANKGGAWEKDYPYKAYDQSCQAPAERPYKIESFHSIQTGDIDAMKAAIMQFGSVGVTMSVCGSIPGYGGGVYDSNECNYYSTNHIVTLVGWDDTVAHKSGKGVWILRNSWGTSWGDGGYGQFAYGKARLEENPTYVVYKPEDPTDTDGDGITDLHDNCKDKVNADQKDADQDGKGDECDDSFDPFEKKVSLSDDDSHKLALGFAFPFYGKSYPEVYLNADGNLTFGAGDEATAPRDKARFLTGAPRIAALYADLNPGLGGAVSWGKQDKDSLFVRFDKVKRYGSDGTGSVTVTLHVSGSITLAYGAVSGPSWVVGVSRGGSGNSAGESALAAGTLAYGGANALYQVFNGGAFGLQNQSLTLTPGTGPTPPPPPTETVVALGDDATAAIPIGFSFPFFGKSYTTVYANSDGNLSFGSGDAASENRDKNRFLTGVPRIAALYRDLDPSAGGTVTYQSKSGKLTLRYQGVRHFGSTLTSSVTIVLHADGLIELAYGQVAQDSFIVGVSKGGSGNTGAEQVLSTLGQPIAYGGTKSIFQAFGPGAAFDLGSKTIAFSTKDDVGPPPPPPPTPTETFLTLGDDATAEIPLGFSFPYFGQTYTTAWVNADGNITLGKGDGVTAERDVLHFLIGPPRIALLYADLDPSLGGTVSYRHDDPQSTTIRFVGVPVWGNGGTATASAKLAASGAVTLSYDSVSIGNAIIGVSKGKTGNGNNNSSVKLNVSGLMQSSWSMNASGSVHTLYASSDPFSLAGKSVTFAP